MFEKQYAWEYKQQDCYNSYTILVAEGGRSVSNLPMFKKILSMPEETALILTREVIGNPAINTEDSINWLQTKIHELGGPMVEFAEEIPDSRKELFLNLIEDTYELFRARNIQPPESDSICVLDFERTLEERLKHDVDASMKRVAPACNNSGVIYINCGQHVKWDLFDNSHFYQKNTRFSSTNHPSHSIIHEMMHLLHDKHLETIDNEPIQTSRDEFSYCFNQYKAYLRDLVGSYSTEVEPTCAEIVAEIGTYILVCNPAIPDPVSILAYRDAKGPDIFHIGGTTERLVLELENPDLRS
jgi:hypothetical protein